MKQLTPRQQQRRDNIMAAARELIADHGYEGVTMRELAARSGVATKTLYLQYDSKENLLTTAVEDLHRATYASIDETDIDNGFDRLFYIIDTISSWMVENEKFSKTITPALSRATTPAIYSQIRRATYGKAVQQIADAGDLQSWIDVETATKLILRHRTSVNTEWTQGMIETKALADVLKLHLCLCLIALTQGETRRRAQEALPVLVARTS